MARSHSTIPELLQATVLQAADKPALGAIAAGQLTWRTWAEVAADVGRVANGLHRADINPGDRVVQFAPNSYEWILTDLAILTLGAVHVPLHATLSLPQAKDLLKRSDAKLLVTSSTELRDLIPTCAYGELLNNDSSPLSSSVKPDDLATILFTSGTTGEPRGVMLSHGNLTSNTIATADTMGTRSDETRLCFLPLSHIYARTCDLYSWLYLGSRLVLAESRETIVRDCQIAKPNVINGVPYFYQKIAHVEDIGSLLGGQLKHCFCGGAAISSEVEKKFADQGLPLLSGYGLTESSPVITATAPGTYQPGIVGRPLPDVEVRIAADGEVLARGPNIMQGYWKNETATREAIVDGWLHTGDLGQLDDLGNLRIIGRQKEIIVLSTGKNVSPTHVEQALAGSPLVEYVCVVGDGRKCLGAIIVPNPESLRAEIRSQRLWVWSRRRAVTHPKVRELYRQEIDRCLSRLSREEQVGPFVLIDRAFSIERGELTAKLSLRRDAIAANFARQIETMYRE